MTDTLYTTAKQGILEGTIDLDADDIRALLCMSNQVADTTANTDALTVTAFTGGTADLDEFDGSGYSSPGVVLTGEVVAVDNANNRSEFTSDAVAFGALGAGTRNMVAVFIYKFVTNLGASIPIAIIESGFGVAGVGLAANGSTVTWTPNAEGILQLT